MTSVTLAMVCTMITTSTMDTTSTQQQSWPGLTLSGARSGNKGDNDKKVDKSFNFKEKVYKQVASCYYLIFREPFNKQEL